MDPSIFEGREAPQVGETLQPVVDGLDVQAGVRPAGGQADQEGLVVSILDDQERGSTLVLGT